MAERANYSPFLPELCELLGVDRPEAATGSGGSYRFERGIDHYEHDGSISRAMLEFG